MLRRRLLALALAACSAAAIAQPAIAQPKADDAAPRVLLSTSEGDITLELDAARAPRSVANFLQYVRAGHYDGTVFHRVIENFMIQGGGFTPDMKQKPTRAPIPIESQNGLKNERGSVAMARTSDPNSATSQFFINVVDNGRLDFPSFDGHGYAVFGKVVSGMDVVDRIRKLPTTSSGPHQNVPAQPVLIRSARVESAAPSTPAKAPEKK
ncbi:MAG: peptidylprolyl isomerase [Burkholderiaceae bacterium]|jgi:peptidyl-prolyl cis-trans isomerase A (cyclophilin A)|nr:peptidylprolyl isomerase [Burkholderiaceae bacterium]